MEELKKSVTRKYIGMFLLIENILLVFGTFRKLHLFESNSKICPILKKNQEVFEFNIFTYGKNSKLLIKTDEEFRKAVCHDGEHLHKIKIDKTQYFNGSRKN